MGGTILAVHTDERLRVAARDSLTAAGHTVHDSPDMVAALRLIEVGRPDLILVPWLGLKQARDALARVRELDATARAIVWTPNEDMRAAVTALELGADDCLAIPFDAAELVARVNACLRRPAAAIQPDQLEAGPLVLDKAVHCLLVNGCQVELAPTEFRLMAFFLENQGRVFSRDEILRRAWSKNVKAGPRTVDVHVRRLRQVLEPFGCEALIQTVRGFGYRFASQARELQPRIRQRQAHVDRL